MTSCIGHGDRLVVSRFIGRALPDGHTLISGRQIVGESGYTASVRLDTGTGEGEPARWTLWAKPSIRAFPVEIARWDGDSLTFEDLGFWRNMPERCKTDEERCFVAVQDHAKRLAAYCDED